MKDYRHLFPMAEKITYLDNSALVLKPISVIEAGNDFYTNYSISPRTADSRLGIEVNQKIEETRAMTADLIDGYPEEIIFTSGTTESLNLFAQMSQQFLKEDDEILISSYNHSSNIIPWIEVAKNTKSKIIYSENILEDINSKTKIVTLSQVTNNINQFFDMDAIYQKVQENGAILINDAAQAVAHEKITFENSDIIAFSANKLYGPTGLGVLAIKKELLQLLKPTKFGGGAVNEIIDSNQWTAKEGVKAFEPGTINIAAVWQFHAAIKFFTEIGLDYVQEKLSSIAKYLYDQLSKIQNVEIASKRGDFLTLFNIKGFNSQDIASYLGHKDIYVRAGTFCSKLIPYITQRSSFVRISLAIYNNKSDIDTLIKAIKEGLGGGFLDAIL
ncbi:aminotransferase class V-fold PLP-dependent enzyme [Mycoplasma iguanae]|uniref:Aminotransferase class V-fold PLP-dependent enzyme n=1 Tax=Mycoplasma iguanae TaxID=292461 RepID=A0ABY5R920_9MOLU|nr:aminotransferase class V-fold PLP-dependent enzyme [Mycoplasma iguanae]UVD81944.1 aminotransferase class V-fold PLP-dependent enzyme [Mycoplasma iguanae]